MPKTKSVELVARDQRVLEMTAEGYTQREIASTLGISAARVNQIKKANWQDFDDDADRQLQKEMLDAALRTTLKYMLGPGDVKTTSTGVAYMPQLGDDGAPLYDERGKPLLDYGNPARDEYSKVRAAETVGRLVQTRARVFGTELLNKAEEGSDITEMIEWAQQMISGSSQLSNENLRLKQLLADHGLHDTVDAEVVEDK